ncbi:MFS transporter [Listeria costaricensis]|uniref:MFS transporter n=1 Tax=Listeria costaricensis TaxID=2026604 RepID=UPI000C0704BF|nr:MFS transporter [Listeria costaricensis]
MENQIVNNPVVADRGNKLKLSEKVTYGVGDLASNLVWGLVGSFLLYFYTDVVLIPVAATGTLFLLARALDAFIDPVIGAFVDRTNTKWGRTRPYMIFGVIPLVAVFILTFSFIDVSDAGKIVYAYITYIIVGLLYSFVNVPYGALMPLMTRNSHERAQMSSFRMVGMAAGNIIVTACAMPLVGLLGGGNERQGFFWTACLFGAVAIISFLFVGLKCKERYVAAPQVGQKQPRHSLVKTYKEAMHNTPWLSTIIFSLFMFIKIGLVAGITIYFCMYVLHNPAFISILLPLLYVSMLPAAAITSLVIKKLGYRKGNILAILIYIATFMILPFFVDNLVVFVIIYFIGNVFGSISSGAVFGMTADSVDYNEWKFGSRNEGTMYAGYSFATKVGMAIGGAAVGYILAFAGYDPNHITAATSSAISVVYFLVPILCSVIQLIALLFYKLDALHPQIVQELEARHAESELPAE